MKTEDKVLSFEEGERDETVMEKSQRVKGPGKYSRVVGQHLGPASGKVRSARLGHVLLQSCSPAQV